MNRHVAVLLAVLMVAPLISIYVSRGKRLGHRSPGEIIRTLTFGFAIALLVLGMTGPVAAQGEHPIIFSTVDIVGGDDDDVIEPGERLYVEVETNTAGPVKLMEEDSDLAARSDDLIAEKRARETTGQGERIGIVEFDIPFHELDEKRDELIQNTVIGTDGFKIVAKIGTESIIDIGGSASTATVDAFDLGDAGQQEDDRGSSDESSNTGGGNGASAESQNRQPIVRVSSPDQVPVGESALLDGSGSTDPDGDDLQFHWMVMSSPDEVDSNEIVGFQESQQASISPVLSTPGTYEFQIAVMDSEETVSETVTVDVVGESANEEPDNTPPTADFTVSPSSPVAGETVTFRASATDPDGSVESYEWDIRGNGDFGSEGEEISGELSRSGEREISLRVTDNNGATDVVSKTITVRNPDESDASGNEEPVNNPPTADFTYSPSNPETGETVQFTADAADSDGSIESYEWDLDGDGSLDSVGGDNSHTFSEDGPTEVLLQVTDDNGATDTVTKTIEVEASGGENADEGASTDNRPPEADFTFSPADPATDETVTFEADASDPDGEITDYEWDFYDDGKVDATGSVTDWHFLSSGTVDAVLRVTDDDGDTDIATKTVPVHSSIQDNEEGNAGPTDTPTVTDTPTPTETPTETDTPTETETETVTLAPPGPISETSPPTPTESPTPTETDAQSETSNGTTDSTTTEPQTDEPGSSRESGSESHLFEIVATEEGGITYEFVVDGAVEKAEVSETISAGQNDQIRSQSDGTVVVEGFTGNTGYGDAYQIDGEIIDYRRVEGDVDVNLRIDGEPVSPSDLSTGDTEQPSTESSASTPTVEAPNGGTESATPTTTPTAPSSLTQPSTPSESADQDSASENQGTPQTLTVSADLNAEVFPYTIRIDGDAAYADRANPGEGDSIIEHGNGTMTIEGTAGQGGVDTYAVAGDVVCGSLDGAGNVSLGETPLALTACGSADASTTPTPTSPPSEPDTHALEIIPAGEETTYRVHVTGSLEPADINGRNTNPDDEIQSDTVTGKLYPGAEGDSYRYTGTIDEITIIEGDVRVLKDGTELDPDEY